MFSHHHIHHRFYLEHPVNEFYFSIFLMNIAENLISVFIPIYLYTLGYSIPLIIFFFFLGNLGSVLFSLPLARVVERLGAKHAMILSMPFLIGYYAGLRLLPDYPLLFAILPILIAIRSLLYNLGFGLNFVSLSDRSRMGSAVSWFQIAAIAGTSFAPLFAGFIITLFGFPSLFVAGCIVLLLSLIPLSHTAPVAPLPPHSFHDVLKNLHAPERQRLHASFIGYAVESSVGRVIWPIFLILIVGTVTNVGTIVTIATIITVILLYLVGKLTDHHHSRSILKIGTTLYFLGWITSPLADNPFRAFCFELYRKISERCILVPWSAAFYRSLPPQAYFSELIVQDLIFNLSRIVLLPLIMVVFLVSKQPFIITFFIASIFTLLYPLAVSRVPNEPNS